MFVDPFIGTGGHGHTHPGAMVPNGMIQPGPDTRIHGWDASSGYYYEDGTLQCDVEQNGIGFQLRRCMKGTLDTVLLNVADVEQYVQWEYETVCGETVLLALGPNTALIVADLEQSFVTVRVLLDSQYPDPITGEQLQAIADSIDFSLL